MSEKNDVPNDESNECFLCKKPLSDSDFNRIDRKPVCNDCYYGELGEEVEKNPLGGHRGKRLR